MATPNESSNAFEEDVPPSASSGSSGSGSGSSSSNPTKKREKAPMPLWKLCRHLRLHHPHNQQRKAKGCPARVEPPNQSSNAFEEDVPPSASSSKPTKRRKRVPCESNNAFEEVVPPSVSASASTSSSNPRTWNVFINHRGPDTKHPLATSIYDNLKSMGLEVFLDQPALDLGDLIPSTIEEAMKTSFLHIAILSPRFAESPWCLSELSYMLNTGKKVIPVFYKVDPGDIRWTTKGNGVYADAFSKHKKDGRYSSEKLDDWKAALQNVTYLTGHIVKENDDEGKEKLLKTIKDYIEKHSQKIPLVVANYPVALEEILQDFERDAFDSSKNINIVGIVGMGGCGKTTLAKEYYNKKKNSIYKCSFIHNVRDEAKNNIHKKQKQMLQDLGFNDEAEKVDNVEKGSAFLAEKLRSVQVFIILDDVDHQYQLEALLPIKDSLGQGSVIVVTSRESGVLKSWGISIYKMKELDPKHAMELFCRYAFRQPSPISGFENLVQKFLEACKGLPLSLKVLGGLVYGETQDYWDSQLKKIFRVLPKDIKDVLKVSFDALDEEEKEIFLDICCFFIGEKEQLAVTVWDGSASGWSGLHSLTVLKNKCLVDLDENRITMHDHLRDMGREIANKGKEIVKSPYRLWSPEQIRDIEIEGQEGVLIRGIRGIRAETKEFYEECMELVDHVTRSPKMTFRRRLEILLVKYNYFPEELATLSAGLVWLRWIDFPHTALPSWLPLNKLRMLELHHPSSLEELWSETANPPVQLRELIIDHAPGLRGFPSSIGRLQHLKKISIFWFYKLGRSIEDLPEDFCRLKSLEHLELRDCKELKSLPSKFGDLRNLQHLNLRNSGLMKLPDSFKQLINLQYINFEYCSELMMLPASFKQLINLQYINFKSCSKLMMLPASFKQLINLQYINFEDCSKLTLEADILENMTKLEFIEARVCGNVTEGPAQSTYLKSLKKLEVDSSHFMELPNNIGQLSKLEELTIISGLKSYDILSLCFPWSLCSLKYISVGWTRVSKISISQQCCPSLETITLSRNDQLVEIDRLPISVKTIVLIGCQKLKSISGVCGLVNLEKLVLCCSGKELEEFPNIEELASLKQFEITCGSGEQLKMIEGVEYCRSLEKVKAHNWLIKSLESLENLRTVELLAWNDISALQPCLQTIEKRKWPSECMVCARTASGVEEALKSWTFPGLTLVDTCRGKRFKTDYLALKCGQRLSSNAAAMVCFVINLNQSSSIRLQMRSSLFFRSDMNLEAGKWVWIGVFTQSSPLERAEELSLEKWSEGYYDEDMGMLMMGEEDTVVEAFYQLLQDLGKNHVIPP